MSSTITGDYKKCDRCGGTSFHILFRVWGIVFFCTDCDHEDDYNFEDYDG